MTLTTSNLIKSFFALFLLFLILAPGLRFVVADPLAPQNLSVGVSERRSTDDSSKNTSVQGGNVTQLDIDVLKITESWAGLYGNITGEITLDDADNNTFYNWTLTSVSGEVFATRVDSPTWASIACAGDPSTEETYLGQLATDSDSVTNTYTNTSHPDFNVSSTTLTGCNATNAFVNSAPDVSRFWQVLLSDGSNIVYTTLIDEDQTGFDGSTYDFQLMVGENNNPGNTDPTTYYVWVEID